MKPVNIFFMLFIIGSNPQSNEQISNFLNIFLLIKIDQLYIIYILCLCVSLAIEIFSEPLMGLKIFLRRNHD
jgi:hypothetical protein